jgi:hypothetical protein
MRLDTAFVKHADTTYCGASLGQSQDIANWSKKERFTPGLPRSAVSGACERKYMRGTVRLGWPYRQQFGILRVAENAEMAPSSSSTDRRKAGGGGTKRLPPLDWRGFLGQGMLPSRECGGREVNRCCHASEQARCHEIPGILGL